ncbi:MAG: 4-hydroxy-3-methylbut-2-enyl diphosphate reductase [Rikenellaceae bacterium]|nr:4-hydroxy-3-methylbut-2-enyl diphosphate reductase [Rikenellaceae bacterium]
MRIIIDDNSGFCFGVVRAIGEAESALQRHGEVFSLGDIVHNRVEVQRLEALGLRTVTHDDIAALGGRTLLIRAHGEPPTTYQHAEAAGVNIIDATCPVVARLQRKVREAYETMQQKGGSVVLLGKRGHAEVVGLTGQVGDDVVVVERVEDLDVVDFTRPIYLLSQTTQSIELFETLGREITQRVAEGVSVTIDDTICRRVAGRESSLAQFSQSVDVVIFVSGRKSSNGKVLYDVCRRHNSRAYNIEEASEIDARWFDGASSVGICGATSTPRWLMERVAEAVEQLHVDTK